MCRVVGEVVDPNRRTNRRWLLKKLLNPGKTHQNVYFSAPAPGRINRFVAGGFLFRIPAI
jgi:hypothetical protein